MSHVFIARGDRFLVIAKIVIAFRQTQPALIGLTNLRRRVLEVLRARNLLIVADMISASIRFISIVFV